MTTAKAQAAGISVAREPTPGTAPTTDWRTLWVNPSGTQNFHPQLIDLARNVQSPNMTDEAPDIVGENATPTLVCDLTVDYVYLFAHGLLRSTPKIASDEGVAFYSPTAAVDGAGSQDSFAVSADGDLLNGSIVVSQGFRTAANNAVFVLEGTSTATAIKVPTASLVAETVSPTDSARVAPTGFQFTAGDLSMDASGNLVTAVQDCTLLNLVDNQEIWIGGIASATAFATNTLNGRAFVNGTVTANLIPLKWHSFTPGVDAGATKTIQLFFGMCLRNVADGHADYIEEPVYHIEKRDTGVGTADAAVFTYSERSAISSYSIAMAVEQKVEITTNFLASKITEPVLAASRKTGPSTASPQVYTELFDTTATSGGGDMMLHRVLKADDFTVLAQKVNSCTLTVEHNTTGQKVLAGDGLDRVNFGKVRVSAQMETFYEKMEVPQAIRRNTTCRYECVFKNGNGAISITLPNGKLRGGELTYGEDSPVMQGVQFKAHRDPVSNVLAIINVFPYLPRGTVQRA